MKVVMIISVCLMGAEFEARIGKHLPDEFPIQYHMKQGLLLIGLAFHSLFGIC
jgi:hypothetical protein